jgi:hypothetical protein
MIINATIGNNVPLGFATAVSEACAFFDLLFSNPVTLNITFQWGPTPPGTVAANTAQGIYTDYNTIKSSPLSALSPLPANDPTNGAAYFVTEAQAKALGLDLSPYDNGGTVDTYGSPWDPSKPDGIVTLNSNVNWDFTRAGGTPGLTDAIGVFEHEISEVMGRVGLLGSLVPTYNPGGIYTILDLFRYTKVNGVVQRVLSPGPGFFPSTAKPF